MLKMVLEGATDFKPELKNGFDYSKVQALNDYLTKNYTTEEIRKLSSPNYFYEVEFAKPGGTFLLNSAYDKNEVWDKLPAAAQKFMIDKKLKFYVALL